MNAEVAIEGLDAVRHDISGVEAVTVEEQDYLVRLGHRLRYIRRQLGLSLKIVEAMSAGCPVSTRPIVGRRKMNWSSA